MERTIKLLSGHSGSQVFLKENSDYGFFIEKRGNVFRNFERMTELQKYDHFRIPRILEYSRDEEILRMEYISGLDMKTYLRYNAPSKLFEFISCVIDGLSKQETYLDVHQICNSTLSFLEYEHPFNFSKSELISSLPKSLQVTDYIGDLTLDNILWNDAYGFVLIDPVTVPYKNILFDLAKLRQDTKCGWFNRNHSLDNNTALSMKYLDNAITLTYPEVSNSLLILMLLRVFLHCKEGNKDYEFIVQKANSLWK